MQEPSTKRPAHSEYDSEHDDAHDGHRPPPGLALDPPEEPPPSHPPEIPVERLDADAIKVIARLRHMRHQAYFVGGCVRDLLLDKTPKDFDVATDAHPGEVRAIFRNCRLIGRRFRLAHVYFRGGKVIEVATFRKNPIDVAEDVPDGGDLLITRDNVFGTAEEDAVRRDFTVNGLFYDVAAGEVIDYVGGRQDLEDHRIATIGDPEIRMREDPVRALRAVRFAARLGFTIAPDTFEAMRRHAGELARCAPPRLLEEIFKILRCGGSARAFELLRACGALPVVLPAVGAALDGADEVRRRGFFAHLTALDRLVRSGEEVSEAVLLGALLTNVGPDAEALLAALVATSRLPRKIAERTKLALHAQRTARDPQRRRRRRGGGGASHQDAVQLLHISVEATGEGRELLDRWTASAPPAGHDGEEQAADTGHTGRGRRHGGGPGRGRGGGHGQGRHGAHGAHPHGPAHAAPAAGEALAADAEPGDEAAAGEDGEEEGGIRTVTVSGDAADAGGSEGPGRRRRRRRGGRRRRRRGGGAPAGGGAPPAGVPS
jgi:poly(A) polymerase